MDEEATRPAEPGSPEPGAYEHLRTLSNARELRALAHPVRMALYEVLALHQSLTATQASKLVGGSPSSVAYHLRTLAKYGYVEETNDGTGRERPWRLAEIGFNFSGNSDDPEANAAADALARQMFKRWLERRDEYKRSKDRWSEEVREATGDSNMILFGTVEEFRELREGFARLTAKYFDRIADPALRPEGSQVFELQLFTHPIDISSVARADDDEDEDSAPEEH